MKKQMFNRTNSMVYISSMLSLLSCKNEMLYNQQMLSELEGPQEIYIESQHNQATVSWNPIAGADGYFVELSKGTAFASALQRSDTITDTRYTFEALDASSDYTVRLRSISLASASLTSKKQVKTFTTAAAPQEDLVPDIIVAKDESGDYTSVQEAIDAVPANRTQPIYIYIKSGIYKEVVEIPQNKPFIHLIGEDKETTILTFDNHSGKPKPGGGSYGTADSRSVYIKGDQFIGERLTFENSAGMDAGQAVALYVDAARSAFKDCKMLGYQDTWYGHNGTKSLLENCYIEGSVDFIFGGSTTLFSKCQVHSNRTGGYITAASTPAEQQYGYVFVDCKLTAANNISEVWLGRPWRPYAKVVFLTSEMGKHIRALGWHNWGNAENEKTAYYAEYKSSGEGAHINSRVSWSHQLTDAEAERYTKEKVLDGWEPAFLPENARIVTKHKK
ncbi:pectinesterase family protein [Sphingobacterium thalpophilum]|uniref:Pectinesterase n=2 Tax=Sphingobacterium thalpophilum TaxID=259 RepID=A0A4U9UZ86_9SPHI|nr:pectinesterase family protein [Sphingobacterium thalpophilum]VTR39380.1 Pectinesterase A precursor [Sphingobacterium thalpophilum]